MDILYLMILCSVSLALIFLIVFIINVKKGQFEDDESPAVRILFDDESKQNENQELNNEKK
ncbi:cbb3-type cytochrome oxidase assembly protein CcoS [Bergeyella cardium]|uniref:cbb3-type cytochrome oxidase assembly protein CcoS n=1 Tax=Bergeyella cardium TaxID=1585976 RepID=UPI000EA25329|nr:cbb3-type cytochrome oxidase assembly protein CcoS [Bergeyella cardium]